MPRRLLALALCTALALSLGSCRTGPAPEPRWSLSPARGSVTFDWAVSPRPAPQPPLQHAAILVPITFDGLDRTFYLQFDLGHPTTTLYSHKWNSIAQRLARPAASKLDRLAFHIASLSVSGRDITIRTTTGPSVAWDRNEPELIGTLGADVIDGRAVLLDFPARTLTFAPDGASLLPPGTRTWPYQRAGRRIKLPARFAGRDVHVLYDSGSSAFAWLTDAVSARRYARAGAQVQSFTVNSWGKPLAAHLLATDSSTVIAEQTLAIGELGYMEGMGFLQSFAVRLTGIRGLVGNELFIRHRLLLDTRTQRFAVLG